ASVQDRRPHSPHASRRAERRGPQVRAVVHGRRARRVHLLIEEDRQGAKTPRILELEQPTQISSGALASRRLWRSLRRRLKHSRNALFYRGFRFTILYPS